MTMPIKLKQRLSEPRALTPVTIRMPADVIDSLKQIAPLRGFSGYQALLKFYVGQGLRADEEKYIFSPEQQLLTALKKLGVDEDILRQAYEEVHMAG